MGTTNDIPNDLSFGLAMTAYQYAVNLDGLIVNDQNDPLLNSFDRRVFIPDFNFGVSFTTTRYYAGFCNDQPPEGFLIIC